MASESIPSKTELLARIHDRRAELERLVARFSPGRLEIAGSAGWSARDHLAHLTAWEKSLLALIHGEDRAEAVGLTHEEHDRMEIDEINQAIFERHRLAPLADILEDFHATHQRVLRTLEAMEDGDLLLPYSHYQPADLPYNDHPVVGWISGNTFDHYDEHIGWLTALLAEL